MVTPSRNMPAMTCEIFIHTSNYMKYLIDEIAKIPEGRVPHGVKKISQELIESLAKFSNQSGEDEERSREEPDMFFQQGGSNRTDLAPPSAHANFSSAEQMSRTNNQNDFSSDACSVTFSNLKLAQTDKATKSTVVVLRKKLQKMGDCSSLPSLNQADLSQPFYLPPSGFGNSRGSDKTANSRNKSIDQNIPKPSSDSSSLPSSLNQVNYFQVGHLPPSGFGNKQGTNNRSLSLASSSTSSPKGDFLDTQSLKHELNKINFNSISRTGEPKDFKAHSIQKEPDYDNNLSNSKLLPSHSSLDSLTLEQNKATNKNTNHNTRTFFVTNVYRKLMENMVNSCFSNYRSYIFYCRCCDDQIFSQEMWNDHLAKNHTNQASNGKNEELFCDNCNLVLFGSKSLMLKYMFYHNCTVHNYLVMSDKKNRASENHKDPNQLPKTLQIEKDSLSAPCETETTMDSLGLGGEVKMNAKRRGKKTKKKKAKEGNGGNNESLETERPNLEASLDGIEIHSPILPPTPIRIEVTNVYTSVFADFIKEAETVPNLNVYGCFCSVCQKYYFSSFSWIDHLDCEEHIAKVDSIGNCESKTCDICRITCFGEPADIRKNFESIDHYNHHTFILTLKQ